MKAITTVIRYMSEKNTSVDNDVLKYQEGYITTALNTDTLVIPCAFLRPLRVFLTSVILPGSDATTTTTTTSKGFQTTLIPADLSLTSWAANTSYIKGQLVKNSGKNYICLESHTSESTFSETKWMELPYIKGITLKFDAATGTGKALHCHYKIEGYL